MKKLTIYFILLTLWGSMLSESQNLSHEQRENSFLKAKQVLVDKILSNGALPYFSVEKQLEILNQLCEFDLGRFLVQRGGLDGYWTQYVVQFPEKKELLKDTLGALETFLLELAPICLATQERFRIFKTQIQTRLKEGGHFASIPCGLMGDLLDLNYSNIQKFSLTGIDLELDSITMAKDYATEKNLKDHCHFIKCDAWNLNVKESFDLIASNGLNIYESNDKKVILLYRQFYNALKEDGILVTSFLTFPCIPGKPTEWKLNEVNQKDALLQKVIFADILSAKWQVYRTEAQTKDLLKKAGFQEINIIYDKAHIFPTIIAQK